jgi:Transposase
MAHQVGLSRRTGPRDSPAPDVPRAPTAAWPRPQSPRSVQSRPPGWVEPRVPAWLTSLPYDPSPRLSGPVWPCGPGCPTHASGPRVSPPATAPHSTAGDGDGGATTPTPTGRATWLGLRPSERATVQDHHQLAQLTTPSPELAEAVALVQDVAGLVHRCQPALRDPWLARAATSPLPPFQRFARELCEDYAAVQAGVTRPWSQGPIEGHIARLKRLKRPLCGQARLDLLARRFLLAACPMPRQPPLQHDLVGAAFRSPVARGLVQRMAPIPSRRCIWALRLSPPTLAKSLKSSKSV